MHFFLLMEKWILSILILILTGTAWGTADSGYTSDIRSERRERYYEIFLLHTPRLKSEKSLQDRIFTSSLSKEFADRYEQKFGRHQAEQLMISPQQFEIYDPTTGAFISAEEYTERQKSFSEYMVRRLTEFHVDNYAKSKPEVKPLYDLKEKISQVEVKVGGVNMDVKYSLSGNFVDVNLKNPYVDSRVVHEFSANEYEKPETRVMLGYAWNKRTYVNTTALGADGILSAGIKRQVTKIFATSWNVSTFTYRGGYSAREHRVGTGFSWSY